MNLAYKIMDLRRKHGWSQEELADKLGVSRQSVSRWELGSAMPEPDKIVQLSNLFGVSCDHLLKDGAIDEGSVPVVETACKTELVQEPHQQADANVGADACALSDQINVPSKGGKIVNLVVAVLWAVAITAYFVWSAVYGGWSITWWIWIAMAFLQALVSVLSPVVFPDDIVSRKELQAKAEQRDLKRSVKIKAVTGALIGSYWIVIAAVYLAWSFLSGAWAISWIIWPIAVSVCAIIGQVFVLVGWHNPDEDNGHKK